MSMILVEVAFDEGCLDSARRDAVDAEFFGVVDGDLAGHGVDGPLAGAVGEALFDANGTCCRADIHDRAVGGEQEREGRLGDEEDAFDVDVHDVVEVFFGGVRNAAYEADASVVDEDVEMWNVREGSGDGGGGGDIHRDGGRAGQLGGERLRACEVDVGQQNVGSGA